MPPTVVHLGHKATMSGHCQVKMPFFTLCPIPTLSLRGEHCYIIAGAVLGQEKSSNFLKIFLVDSIHPA